MSERKQRRAGARRDNALEREARARERANRNRQVGETTLARMHDETADLQAEAAAAAERARLRDVQIEGDQIDGN